MTLAEIEMVIDKRLAWRLLAKGCAILFTVCSAVVSVIYIPVLAINTLTNRADANDANVAELKREFKDLSRSMGGLQITVAKLDSKVEVSQGKIEAGITQLLQQQQRPAPPARTATVPRRTQ